MFTRPQRASGRTQPRPARLFHRANPLDLIKLTLAVTIVAARHPIGRWGKLTSS
jgi:hypothetical protein